MNTPQRIHALKEHNDGSRHAFFYITYQCDARCSYCYVGNELLDSALEMPFAQVKNILDSLVKRHSCSTVTFLGGEPLLHSSIEEILICAKQQGLKVIVDTNGGKAAQAKIDMLANIGVDCLSFSVDSLKPAINSRLRRSGLLEASLKTLGLAKNLSLRTRITSVMTSLNFEELPELLSFFEAQKVDILNIHIFMPQGNGKARPELALARDDLDKVIDTCLDYSRRNTEMELRFPLLWHDSHERLKFATNVGYAGCLSTRRDSLNIWPDGRVVACPFVQRECALGHFDRSGHFVTAIGGEDDLIRSANGQRCYWLSLNVEANIYYRNKLNLSADEVVCPAWKISSYNVP